MSEFWQGVWFGLFTWWFIIWLLKQIIVSVVVNHIKEQQKAEEVLLKLEKVGNMIYCYRKDTDEFIGQAATLQEIANIYKQRFPNNNAKILKEDSAGVL
jgi:hypothetical protein